MNEYQRDKLSAPRFLIDMRTGNIASSYLCDGANGLRGRPCKYEVSEVSDAIRCLVNDGTPQDSILTVDEKELAGMGTK